MYKVNDLLQDLELGQTTFQNVFFVVNKNGLTNYGKYRQALRELQSRKDALISTAFELQEINARINELKEKDDIYSKIELRKNLYNLKKIKNELNRLKREFMDFYNITSSLKAVLGELTEEKKSLLEKEYWLNKVLFMALIDYHSVGTLTKPTVEILKALPLDMQDQFRRKLQKKLGSIKNEQKSLEEVKE